MAPLETEWLLWAKRLKDEHQTLLQRIDAATQTAAQIDPLVERTKDLAARNDHVQEGYNELLNRVLKIEQNADATIQVIARIEPLLEQTKDLAASSEHLQAENHALKDRIALLEQDASDRDGSMALKNKRLESIINALKQELDLVGSLDGRICRLEEEYGQSVEATANREAETLWVTEEGRAQRDTRKSGRPSPASFAITDMSVNNNNNNDRDTTAFKGPSQGTPRESSIVTADSAEVQTERCSNNEIGLEPQDKNTTLEEYVAYGQKAIANALRAYEARVVKTFVGGMQAKQRIEDMWELLREEGWTWRNAKEHLLKIVNEERRRKRKRKRLHW